MASSGIDSATLVSYVQTSKEFYNLSADNVIYLKNSGVPLPVISAMLSHDQVIMMQNPAAVHPTPMQPIVSSQPAAVETAPAGMEATPFYRELSPHGTWVFIAGEGWCWQPSGAYMTPGWRPYCDNGYWVQSDYGWYWQSGYPWGEIAFHYGRWSMDPRHGWVWMPDTVWGPAWVVWRHNDAYCGWAPLPPHAVFDARLGLMYRGHHVAETFDFGFGDNFFMFVSVGDIGRHDWRAHMLPAMERSRIFHDTAVVNIRLDEHGFNNRGIAAERVAAAMHSPIERLAVREPVRAAAAVHSEVLKSGISERAVGHEERAAPAERSFFDRALSEHSSKVEAAREPSRDALRSEDKSKRESSPKDKSDSERKSDDDRASHLTF
jgi:hypothetical protein